MKGTSRQIYTQTDGEEERKIEKEKEREEKRQTDILTVPHWRVVID